MVALQTTAGLRRASLRWAATRSSACLRRWKTAFTLDELNHLMATGLDGGLSLSLDAVVAVKGRNRRDICHDLVLWALADERVGLHGLLAAALRTNGSSPQLLDLQKEWAGVVFTPPAVPLSRHEALHDRPAGTLLWARSRDCLRPSTACAGIRSWPSLARPAAASRRFWRPVSFRRWRSPASLCRQALGRAHSASRC